MSKILNHKAVYDYLPKFYQMEVNNLKGLHPGFVIAQMPFKANDALLKAKFNFLNNNSEEVTNMLANGHICTLTNEGLASVSSANDALCICYNDPIMTVFKAYNTYATDLDGERSRAVILQPGDEWTTDIDYFAVVGGEGEDKDDYVYPGADYLEGRIFKVVPSNAGVEGIYESDDWFANDELPDGTKAFHYVFLR